MDTWTKLTFFELKKHAFCYGLANGNNCETRIYDNFYSSRRILDRKKNKKTGKLAPYNFSSGWLVANDVEFEERLLEHDESRHKLSTTVHRFADLNKIYFKLSMTCRVLWMVFWKGARYPVFYLVTSPKKLIVLGMKFSFDVIIIIDKVIVWYYKICSLIHYIS